MIRETSPRTLATSTAPPDNRGMVKIAITPAAFAAIAATRAAPSEATATVSKTGGGGVMEGLARRTTVSQNEFKQHDGADYCG